MCVIVGVVSTTDPPTDAVLAAVVAFALLARRAGPVVQRGTVLDAVAISGFAIAGVLLLVPLLALSPVVKVGGGLGERAMAFLVLLVTALILAAVAATVGWVASRFVPDDGDASVD